MTIAEAPPVIALPAALLLDGYGLRPEADGDAPFLLRLFESTRIEELAVTGWSPEQKHAFVAQQFQAQRHHYRTAIAGCQFHLIEWNGAPVGRLYLDFRVTSLHVVDIALLPEIRGRGVGTAILTALIDMAQETGRSLGIFVEHANPALRLYRRLGFTVIRDTGIHLEMECTGATGAQSSVS